MARVKSTITGKLERTELLEVDWEVICSFLSAFAAIVALAISVVQIRMSNRQQLFARRLSVWTKARGLMELCKSNRRSLEKKADGPEFSNPLLFVWLTNNSFLCDISLAAGHTLEHEWQRPFLSKLEEIRVLSFEAGMVFRGAYAEALSEFISSYESLLMSMYKYQIILEQLHENAERFNKDLDRTIEAVGEIERREELYKSRLQLLNALDGLSPKVLKKINSKCKLTLLS